MDTARLEQELELLRTRFPDLEYMNVNGAHWVRLPSYPVPAGWSHTSVEIVFQIPAEPAVAPYAFCVRPALTIAGGGTPSNYTPGVTTHWGDGFAQFSWSPQTSWVPRQVVRDGPNMLRFAASFAERLAEAS